MTIEPPVPGRGQLQVRDVHAYLDRHMHTRQVNKVLHGFPSPRFWQDTEVPLADVLKHRTVEPNHGLRRFHLYVATPYCPRTDPEKCGYCLFPVEVFKGMGDLEAYLSYLEREGHMYKDHFKGDEPTSIYFGGGTPNLYKAEQYPRLMDIVRGVFPKLDPRIVITLEGIPQLFTRQKLIKMKEAGINRVSIGAQQLNDDLNKFSGRQQTVKQVLQAIEWCQEVGLECNVDLIFGWPGQTVDRMLEELDKLVGTGVRHITHYELNVGGPSDFALNRRALLPTEDENLLMYRASRDLLAARGFRQLTVYDYEKPESVRDGQPLYEECLRQFDGFEGFGWGYAALSEFPGTPHAPGWTYLNARAVGDYTAAIDQGRFPIERGFHFSPQDLRLAMLFRNLQGMEADRTDYRRVYGVDLLEEFRPIWQALAEREWLEITPEKLRLAGDGVFYTPLIQTLLASSRIEELKQSQVERRLTPDRQP